MTAEQYILINYILQDVDKLISSHKYCLKFRCVRQNPRLQKRLIEQFETIKGIDYLICEISGDPKYKSYFSTHYRMPRCPID